MRVRMYECISACVCMYVKKCVYVRVHVYMHVRVHLCVYVGVHMNECVCIFPPLSSQDLQYNWRGKTTQLCSLLHDNDFKGVII